MHRIGIALLPTHHCSGIRKTRNNLAERAYSQKREYYRRDPRVEGGERAALCDDKVKTHVGNRADSEEGESSRHGPVPEAPRKLLTVAHGR